MHWNGLNSDLKHFLKHIFRRGANLSKIQLTNKCKLWKMAKDKQSNLIASVKMLNIGVINNSTINLEIGGYPVLVNTNHSSQISSLPPLPHLYSV